MTSDPRQNALDALNMLDQGRFHLDHIIQELFGNNARPMIHRDRALFNTLVFGVTRWRKRLDWIISHHSNVPVKKIRPEVQNILRLGLFQIFFLDRIPASAAVNTAVNMTKKIAAVWTVRFVNGLLRNAIRKTDDIKFPMAENNPVAALAVSRSFPEWLVKRWLDRFGFEETCALCDAVNDIPPLTIRTNTLKIDREKLAKLLASEAGSIEPTGVAPDGLRLGALNTPIDRMQAFKNGLFQIQDEAAQLISLLLHPCPGEAVLDACAGSRRNARRISGMDAPASAPSNMSKSSASDITAASFHDPANAHTAHSTTAIAYTMSRASAPVLRAPPVGCALRPPSARSSSSPHNNSTPKLVIPRRIIQARS